MRRRVKRCASFAAARTGPLARPAMQVDSVRQRAAAYSRGAMSGLDR